MSYTPLHTKPRNHGASALNASRHQPRREPTQFRPYLEHLEERTLLDASSGLIGGVNNLAFNSAPASSGIILTSPTIGVNAPAGTATSNQAATSAFLAQDQLYSQFFLFGVNSQGANFQQSQQMTTDIILRDAYGFGSGTQPNAPWMPNAYNLGLANRQFGSSSQNDMGFQSVPPWASQGTQIAEAQPRNRDASLDKDRIPFLQRDEETAQTPRQGEDERTTNDSQQAQHEKLLKDAGENNMEVNEMLDRLAEEKLSHTVALSHTEDSVPRNADIPDIMWLSALAPAPMAALVVGLPGIGVAVGAGETSAGAAE